MSSIVSVCTHCGSFDDDDSFLSSSLSSISCDSSRSCNRLVSFLLLLFRLFFFRSTFLRISLCRSADSAFDSHGDPGIKLLCSIFVLESESVSSIVVGAVSPVVEFERNDVVRFLERYLEPVTAFVVCVVAVEISVVVFVVVGISGAVIVSSTSAMVSVVAFCCRYRRAAGVVE